MTKVRRARQRKLRVLTVSCVLAATGTLIPVTRLAAEASTPRSHDSGHCGSTSPKPSIVLAHGAWAAHLSLVTRPTTVTDVIVSAAKTAGRT